MSYGYYEYRRLMAIEYERRCRDFFASKKGVTPGETMPHKQNPRCPAYWRGSDRRWG